jgi:hypothetical protein
MVVCFFWENFQVYIPAAVSPRLGTYNSSGGSAGLLVFAVASLPGTYWLFEQDPEKLISVASERQLMFS